MLFSNFVVIIVNSLIFIRHYAKFCVGYISTLCKEAYEKGYKASGASDQEQVLAGELDLSSKK